MPTFMHSLYPDTTIIENLVISVYIINDTAFAIGKGGDTIRCGASSPMSRFCIIMSFRHLHSLCWSCCALRCNLRALQGSLGALQVSLSAPYHSYCAFCSSHHAFHWPHTTNQRFHPDFNPLTSKDFDAVNNTPSLGIR